MWGAFLNRIIVAAIMGIGGWRLATVIAGRVEATNELTWILALSLASFVCGFLLAPYFTTRPLSWTRRRIQLTPVHNIMAPAIGLAFALVITALITLPLSMLPGLWGQISPFAAAVFLICIFVPISVIQGRAVLQFFLGASPSLSKQSGGTSKLIILDTNAIIDGRIADIIQTGFIHGTLLIPKFVLEELRHIADSSDPLRRNRGRRGLETLARLQKELNTPIHISDIDFTDSPEVDSKLITLAKTLRCTIASNDLNLCQVAALQGIKVLNINKLADAIKPMILPGEELILRITQEGKEAGQGIGFLDDGTVVVVEGGRQYLNTEVNVSITRILQTAAGRMVFAHLKESVSEKSEQ